MGDRKKRGAHGEARVLNLRFLFGVARPVIFFREPTNSLRL